MFVRYAILLMPFVMIAYIHWVRSLQLQRQQGRPVTTIQQRDTRRYLSALRRRRMREDGAHDEGTAGLHPAKEPTIHADHHPQQEAAVPTVAKTQAPPTSFAGPAPPVEPIGSSKCPATRKPFHTLLTATAQVYQQWQCRVMYYHWKKQRALDPAGACTEMTGLTRLVAHGQATKDGLEAEMPTFFVKEYGQSDYVRFKGYRVINRPYSVVQLLASDYWKREIREDYIYIAETDHVLTQPLPNLAAKGSPMAYIFNYMGPNPAHQSIIKTAWPEGGDNGWKSVQSIGPSPVVIHRDDLEAIAKPWEATAVHLKTNAEADNRLGWVIEMWGYAIAAAKIGLRHQEFKDFQVEPGALSTTEQLRGFPTRYWVFHYTYQFEYMLDGKPCQPWTIGEFSLDKRHFSDRYPVPPLPQPPRGANAAAFFLLNAFNEAMMNISSWPERQKAGSRPVQTLYGRRRLDWFSRHANGFATEYRTMPLVKKVAGTSYKCSPAGGKGGEAATVEFTATGDVRGLPRKSAGGWGGFGASRDGRWGSMNDPTLGDACPVYSCLYADAGGGAQHEIKVATDLSTMTIMSHADLTPQFECTLSGGRGFFG